MQMETNFAYIDENYKRIVDAIEEAKAHEVQQRSSHRDGAGHQQGR